MIHTVKLIICLTASFLVATVFADDSRTIQRDPEVLLQRIRSKMAEHQSQLHNYTCHMVVDRTTRSMYNGSPSVQDRLELDVAFVDGREHFSRPGALRFADRPIGQLVPPGMISNDALGSSYDDVLSSGVVSFKYLGLCKKDGHTTLRYSFDAPQQGSQLTVKQGSEEAMVGYKGSLWVDAVTFDFVRLEWTTQHIPSSIGIRSIERSLHYELRHIGNSEFLLPVHSELASFDQFGTYRLNAINLERCREFTGESAIKYGAPIESGEGR